MISVSVTYAVSTDVINSYLKTTLKYRRPSPEEVDLQKLGDEHKESSQQRMESQYSANGTPSDYDNWIIVVISTHANYAVINDATIVLTPTRSLKSRHSTDPSGSQTGENGDRNGSGQWDTKPKEENLPKGDNWIIEVISTHANYAVITYGKSILEHNHQSNDKGKLEASNNHSQASRHHRSSLVWKHRGSKLGFKCIYGPGAKSVRRLITAIMVISTRGGNEVINYQTRNEIGGRELMNKSESNDNKNGLLCSSAS